MSFTAVAPSTNVLNGYNDAGEASATATAQAEATAKAQAKEAKKEAMAKTKASTAKPDDWGAHGTGIYQQYTTLPTPPTLTTEQILAQAGIPTTTPVDQHSADPFFIIVVPLFILIGLIWGGMKLLIWDIRKNPPYGLSLIHI